MSDLGGRTLRGYELREQLGSGGFGAVYRAYQAVIEREVAIKVILPSQADNPEFIRRFETEAQVVARLEHPYIVPLYDYWREPGSACLVMRLLRGGSLRAEIRAHGAAPLEKTSRRFEQITSALATAHHRNIIHRDIKPDNILLDEEGNAYLTDFGIAKRLDVTDFVETGITGSPAYIAPEQITNGVISVKTDIYSLGITLYEMLTGMPPFGPDLGLQDLIDKHLNEPTPPLDRYRADLPEALNRVIQVATAKLPENRYADVFSMAEEFRTALGSTPAHPRSAAYSASEARPRESAVVPVSNEAATYTPSSGASLSDATWRSPDEIDKAQNPFKGLRAFQEADADDFFGRRTLVDQLLRHWRAPESRFLTVVGPSGSGKSSVVSAGLLPALRSGALPNSENWFYVSMVPGTAPWEEMASALRRVAITLPPDLIDQLQADPDALSILVAQSLPNEDSELVLFIDQFEELFTLTDNPDVQASFLNALRRAVTNPASRLRVILTLRADFYDRPLLYPEFGDLVRRNTEVVLPLTDEALREAIEGPLQDTRVMLQAGLIDVIIQDVREQPGALPLLQYALTELFERRQGRQLTLEAYRSSGGVPGSLAQRAEEIYQALPPESQAVTRQLFLRLVAPGEGTDDARRRVLRTELIGIGQDASQLNEILDTFNRYRLLTFDRDLVTHSPSVEIAHEALIRTWPRLRDWLASSREDLLIQRRLTLAANEWINTQQDPSYLAAGARLEQFGTWAKTTTLAPNSDERDYLSASVAARSAQQAAEAARKAREAVLAARAQNFGRVAAIFAIVGVLAVLATVLAITQTSTAQSQVMTATVAQGQAIQQQQTSVMREAGANTQVAHAGETLTPVQVTLAAGSTRMADIENQIAIVGQTLTPVPPTLQAAQTHLAVVGQTLTPIPPMLTAVAQNLAEVNAQFESQRLAVLAASQTNQGHPDTALLLAVRALKTAYTVQADAVLTQAVDALDSDPNYARLILTAHAGGVADVAWLPDSRRFVTGGADQTAKIWDAATGRELVRLIGHSGPVRSVACSPDGSTILTASDDKTARLWDATNGALQRTLTGHTASVTRAAFSPDGKTILTGSDDKTARLWDATSGAPIASVDVTAEVRSVAFSPDGQQFLIGSADGAATLWQASTRQKLMTFQAKFQPQKGAFQAFFSFDGKSVLSSIPQVWDAATGSELQPLPLLRILIGQSNLAFSPDGHLLASGNASMGQVNVVNLDTTTLDRQLTGHEGPVNRVAFSPDNRFLLSGSDDGTVRLWNAYAGDLKLRGVDHPLRVAFSPDGRFMATVRRLPSTESYLSTADFSVWDLTSRQLLWHQKLEKITTIDYDKFAVAPDGRSILLGTVIGDIEPNGTSKDGIVHVDMQTGSVLQKYFFESSMIQRAYFSPTGRRILIEIAPVINGVVNPQKDQYTAVYDTATGNALHKVDGQIAAISPNDRLIGVARFVTATSSDIRVLNLESGEEIFKTKGGGKINFSPDGQSILVDDVKIPTTTTLWQLSTGKALQTFQTGSYYGLFFEPNGRYFLAGSNIWDVKTGRIVRQLTQQSAQAMALSADGRYVLLSGAGGLAGHRNDTMPTSIWNTDTGQEIKRGQSDSLNHSPDGSVAIFYGSNQVSMMTMYLPDALGTACNLVRRDFTVIEREQFNLPLWEPTCDKFGPVGSGAADLPKTGTRVYGPGDVELKHNPGSNLIPKQGAMGTIRDSMFDATFANPYDARVSDWTIGVVFRETFLNSYRLIVTSRREWYLALGSDTLVARGTVSNLDLSQGGTNHLLLYVSDNEGRFYMNGVFAGQFTVSANKTFGYVEGATGLIGGSSMKGAVTRILNMVVWSLDRQPAAVTGPTPTLQQATPIPPALLTARQ